MARKNQYYECSPPMKHNLQILCNSNKIASDIPYRNRRKTILNGGPKDFCSDLNDNVPPQAQIFEYLVDGRWCCLYRFRFVAFLKKVCHWGQALGFKIHAQFPIHSLSAFCHLQDMRSQDMRSPATTASCYNDSLL